MNHCFPWERRDQESRAAREQALRCCRHVQHLHLCPSSAYRGAKGCRPAQGRRCRCAGGDGSVVCALQRGDRVKVTEGVGTMWCAYAFAVLAIVSLPSAIQSGSAVTLVSWISQTFLQLVLLSIIIVGQNVLAAAADKRSEATYEDADAVLHTSLDIQQHLEAQDAELERILAEVRQLRAA